MSGSEVPLFERLLIESHSDCNRACWFCPRTFDRSGVYRSANGGHVRRSLPTRAILNLLDQAKELGFRGQAGFHHYSEPLLDERNLELAREAATRGMRPYLHTNGDRLRSDPRLCDLVSRLYARIVVGLYDYETSEQLEDEKQAWRKRLPGVKLEFSPIGVRGADGSKSIGVPRALVPTDSRMALPDLTYGGAPCHRPLVRMIIRYDGEMCLCCDDRAGAFRLGNALQTPLAELWGSSRRLAIVHDLLQGKRDGHALCRDCPQSPTGPPPTGNRIEIRRRNRVEG